jgi:hypothetical protein
MQIDDNTKRGGDMMLYINAIFISSNNSLSKRNETHIVQIEVLRAQALFGFMILSGVVATKGGMKFPSPQGPLREVLQNHGLILSPLCILIKTSVSGQTKYRYQGSN